MYKIPKTIHYCWFGRGQMPNSAMTYISSWKKLLPDYDFQLWNEDNFDINTNAFVREAYEQKKFAFVTDYVRLYALYHYGGIYMDTDVEVIKSLDQFRKYGAFTSCEDESMCVTGLIGAEQYHPWIKELLDDYKEKKFIIANSKFNDIPNTKLITDITIKSYGWLPKNDYQILKNDLHIFPMEYFCANDWRTHKVTLTENTYTIHHFNASWISDEEKRKFKKRNELKQKIIKIFGEQSFNLFQKVRFYFRKN